MSATKIIRTSPTTLEVADEAPAIGAIRGGRVALVTGAASGIGRAVACRLAREGYDLALVDIDASGLDVVGKEIRHQGLGCVAIECNLTETEDFSGVVKEVSHSLGDIDVLVNNAGRGIAADIVTTSRLEWDTTIALNLTAVFETCRAVLPGMISRQYGVIVNISSVAGLVGLSQRAAYCASKAGVLGLTRALAADHARDGIRVNAVCPGTVDTSWIDRILAEDPDPVGARKRMEERQLTGRLGRPEEIAAAVAYLIGDEAGFVNGSCFVIDGGMTAV